MPPLPALQVRVPSSANALLAAEPVLRGRAERNALAQQEQRRGQIGNLLSADLTDPTVRQQVQSKAFAIDPQAGAQIQTMFRQMSAEERANTERDAQTLSRAFFGVNDQAGFDAARAALPEHLREGVGTVFQREGVQAIVQGGLAVSDLFNRETARLPTPPLSEARQNQLLELAEAGRSGGSGFSLSAGQTRFDAAGNPIASVPATAGANTVTLSPGSRVVNTDTGAVIAENPAAAPTPPRPVTLGPGQALVDTTGAVIAERPSAPGRPLTLSPGQALVSPTGAPLAQGPATPQPGFSLSPGQERFDAAGNPIANVPAAPTAAETSLGEINADLTAGRITNPQALLLAQRALAPGETFRPITDAERGLYGLAPDQPAQISETTGKVATIGSGGVEVNVDLSTKTQGRIEGDILNNQDALGRLTAIENSFDPTFQQIFTRAGIKFDQLQAKFGDLSPGDQARLERAAVFQQNAIENVNSTIRALTGAQMSQFEAQRITSQLPNPGTGIFDGDDPVSFEAKMRNATGRIRVILARRVWAEANGRDALTTGFDMDGSVSEIVNKRGQEIEDAFKAQGMTGEELNAAVDERLRVEFGGLL